jgi:peptidyl-tRNA hydrolase
MGEYDIKQYLILNSELGMTKGKQVAQASHASMKVFFDRMSYIRSAVIDGPPLIPGNEEEASREEVSVEVYKWRMTEEMAQWKDGAFAKISLKSDEDMMREIEKLAIECKAPVACINDNGVTQVKPGSFTAMAVGPIDTTKEKYKELMSKISSLKLL